MTRGWCLGFWDSWIFEGGLRVGVGVVVVGKSCWARGLEWNGVGVWGRGRGVFWGERGKRGKRGGYVNSYILIQTGLIMILSYPSSFLTHFYPPPFSPPTLPNLSKPSSILHFSI